MVLVHSSWPVRRVYSRMGGMGEYEWFYFCRDSLVTAEIDAICEEAGMRAARKNR